MHDPIATYRIQFHKGFTFNDLEQIIPYLHELGVKTIYASPIFESTPGSTHGYDVTDPLCINPEIGTLQQLQAISKRLHELHIGWLQDIVPNHMAFHPNNKWLMDVLEKGKQSVYAGFFDILWESQVYEGRVMVPFLGAPLNDVINNGELQVELRDGRLFFTYGGQRYPLNSSSYDTLGKLGGNLPAAVKKANRDTAVLHQLAGEQYFQLCYWQETDTKINFRRFFTVNGLICLNIQRPEVFEKYHGLIKTLVDMDVFQGLRVDHIDGLHDPEQYLTRLRKLAGEKAYIIVEKILEAGETFPVNWPVQGNTGYDFLGTVNNLFTKTKSKDALTRFYRSLTHQKATVIEGIREKKQLILQQSMAGELENLYRLFISLKLADSKTIRAMSKDNIKQVIAQLLIRFPVYRFYGNVMPLSVGEANGLVEIFRSIRDDFHRLRPAADLLENVLLNKTHQNNLNDNTRALRIYQRLMQFTGPLMAKGVEDTLMYTYNRFIGHNEVGDSPEAFGLSTKEFHRTMELNNDGWPFSMLTTATHDTKRGEDVRARLNVLTDVTEEWLEIIPKWQALNAGLKINNAPDINDEYFIYQTIAGAHPMPGQDNDDFTKRLQEYLVKALREGKTNSNWAEPNKTYEDGVSSFISNILDANSSFIKSFAPFHQRIADYGVLNSLSQVLLKYTCPGVPDLYQGCELWDLSLVDPDNRRPVDYSKREAFLDEVASAGEISWKLLWENRFDAKIKLTLTQLLLKERGNNADVFTNGKYIPLKIKGKYKDNVLAFARNLAQEWYIVALPLHFAAINNKNANIADFDWKDTRIKLPSDAPLHWKSLLTVGSGYATEDIAIRKIFKEIPLAIFKLEHAKNERAAGILTHITSLPSDYGIGDLGAGAFTFADFLYEARQKYWQLLPVNPVDESTGHSPYSSVSSLAGNVLLISPELLKKDGLLTDDDLSKYRVANNGTIDFKKAGHYKLALFETAWKNFKSLHDSAVLQQFIDFKKTEADWLNDFAVYEVLKTRFKNEPWYNWPKEFKLRNKTALLKTVKQEADTIDKVKWLQFMFSKQWMELKSYCLQKNITLFGDMPFYVSYDSVDVWSHPQLFKLDDTGKMAGMAGVPPDYFSAEGQLWGMPVYNWDELKKNNYAWWIKRVKKNLEYFDLIRLDHFRAFADYWEVPTGEKTAKNGSWKPGPGLDFFEYLKRGLGSLPFVAEDLGEINAAVHELHDNTGLPGMKVLQFAFDEAMPFSDHIPHNYTANNFVYTGTHDNNTLLGWYRNDITGSMRKRIEKYAGKKTTRKNLNDVFLKLAYASIAKVAVLPVQDIVGLEGGRMNIPSSAEGNWTWRLDPALLTSKRAKQLREYTILYNR